MRLGKLNQNQFAYEDERVLDVVMQGHAEMWHAMQERDRIYADPNATDDGLHEGGRARSASSPSTAATTAEARAGEHPDRRRHRRVAPRRADARGAARA